MSTRILLILFVLIIGDRLAGGTDPSWIPNGILPSAPMIGPVLCQGAYLTPRQGEMLMEAAESHFTTASTWTAYSQLAKARIKEGLLLSPLPRRHPLNPILASTQDHDGYTCTGLTLETIPGFRLGATLYLPKGRKGPFPGILTTHGHIPKGRFDPNVQIRSAMLARMGAVVLAIDMFGYGDTRAEVGSEAHAHPWSMTIQVWDAMRGIDYLVSCPEVDASRVAVTGESGGATQDLLITALDDRVRVSLPVVMVSSYFFGGCPCESGLPIHRSDGYFANDALIAALAAPRPQLVISDGSDWTARTPEEVMPFLRQIYSLAGAPQNIASAAFPKEQHDYGPSKREAAYQFLARQLKLDTTAVFDTGGKLDESPAIIESEAELSGWTHSNPPHTVKPPEILTALRGGDSLNQ